MRWKRIATKMRMDVGIGNSTSRVVKVKTMMGTVFQVDMIITTAGLMLMGLHHLLQLMVLHQHGLL